MDRPTELPTLDGERLRLRPTREGDAGALLAILDEPEVRRWWGANDLADVRGEHIDPARHFAIEIDGRLGGLLETVEETEPDYRHVGLDIALATAHHGRGYGREALALAIGHFIARGHHRFTIDPAAANEQAIRCYTAVGFRPVGRLRDYERAPDGSWRDGLLMDLLAREFDG